MGIEHRFCTDHQRHAGLEEFIDGFWGIEFIHGTSVRVHALTKPLGFVRNGWIQEARRFQRERFRASGGVLHLNVP